MLKIILSDPKGKKYDIPKQVDEIYLSVQKYVKDVNYDEEKETIVYKEIMQYEEKSVHDSILNSEWCVIEMIKKDEK